MNEAILENARCAIAVDETGAITHIVNKRTGTDHITGAAPAGWKLLTTLGSWTEHPVRPADNRGSLAHAVGELVVHFDKLRGAQGARLDVAFSLHFELGPDDEGVRAWYAIENRSPETVSEAWFPVLAGLRDRQDGVTSLVMPAAIARRIDDPASALPREWLSMPTAPRATLGVAYPGPASMGWFDAGSDEEGLYVASHARDARRITHLMRGGRAAFDAGFATYPFVPPGGSYRSGTFMIQPHTGDWRSGADAYGLFAADWETRNAVPWLRRAPGVRLAFLKHQTGHVYARYRDLRDMYRELSQRGLERVPLLVFGWSRGGHDAQYPEFGPDDDLGGERVLRRALDEIRSEGGRVVLYANGLLMDRAGAYYRSAGGAAACMKNREGVPYVAEYSYAEESTVLPGKTFALWCPGSRSWRDRLTGMLDRVMDLGASGILFDQFGGYEAYLCFDGDHDHESPGRAHAAKVDLLRDIRRRAASRDAEFGIMVEMHADRFVAHADLTHSASYGSTVSLPGEPFVEAFRRALPHVRFTTRDAWDRTAVNYAFTHGLVFECVERTGPARMLLERKQRHRFEGEVLDRIDEMMRMRLALEDHLLAGRYLGDADITAEPASAVACAYEAADGSRAIVVWNRDAQPRRVSCTSLAGASAWEIRRLDGSTQRVAASSAGCLGADIGADDVVVARELPSE
jgi:hypothetical protein